MRLRALVLILFFTLPLFAARPRARDAGVVLGILPPGPLNAITDVAGVRVGQTTVVRGNARSGVTIVLPHGGNLFRDKVPAAVFVGNGFGKLIGSTQIDELGELESPIALTSTLNVPRVADALLDHLLALPGNEEVKSMNVVVGETNDGRLNDIRARPVNRDDVFAALRNAKDGMVEEGSVGAGAGTVAFGWKGGIGTASRKLPAKLGGWTIGALVQTNYGGILTINGAPVGRELGQYYLQNELENANGSIMIVLATDAPVDARNLRRLGARAMFGLARTGAAATNGSGDYAIAFSTARDAASLVKNDDLSPLFLAAIEATEEAIVNSLFAATDAGDVKALPLGDTLRVLRAHHALAKETKMTRATGTFDVKLTKAADTPVARMTLDKQFHGDLEATSQGEMLSAGSPQSGSAGYVAMEIVRGTLHGKRGTFALQHNGTMDAGTQSLTITVVPGSGTEELAGISGSLTIEIKDGKHFYALEYEVK